MGGGKGLSEGLGWDLVIGCCIYCCIIERIPQCSRMLKYNIMFRKAEVVTE
jgi:hypothetical protein